MPGSQATNITQHHLFISVVDQLDGIRWALSGAGATSLAQSRVDESSPTKVSDPMSINKVDDLGDAERTGPGAGKTANTFVWIHFGDDATQV